MGLYCRSCWCPKKMLNAGQYADLGQSIQEISGFDIDSINNYVEQAKN